MSSDIVNTCSTVGRCEPMKKASEHTKGKSKIGDSWQKHADTIMTMSRQSLQANRQYTQSARLDRITASRLKANCISQSIADTLRLVTAISGSSSNETGMAMPSTLADVHAGSVK